MACISGAGGRTRPGSGRVELTANAEGMKLNGRALLASIPAKLDAAMDFRAGPPTQVVQSVTVSGQPDARQLAAAGLDATSMMTGAAQVQAVLSERRNGQGDVAVTADLTGAELVVAALEWRKPRDAPAKASARVLLDHDRLTGIEAVQLDGDGLVAAWARGIQRRPAVSVSHGPAGLGRTVAQGTVNLPTAGPIAVQSQRCDARSGRVWPGVRPRAPPRAPRPSRPGAAMGVGREVRPRADGAGQRASDVVVHAENDGRMVRQLRVEGRTGAGAAFTAKIVPDRGGRRLTASVDDAGELLRGLDYVRSMQGGSCRCRRNYDDAQPDRPLGG